MMTHPDSTRRASLLPLATLAAFGMISARTAHGQLATSGAAPARAFPTVPAARVIPDSARTAATAPDSASRRVAEIDLMARTAAALPARAESPAVAGPDRPGYSFTPIALPAGGAQLETGYTDARTGSVRYQSIGEQLLRVGVGAATEVRLAMNSYGLRTVVPATVVGSPVQHAYGFEDASIGIKHQVVAGHGAAGLAATSVAVLASTSIPTGARAISAGAWQPTATLIVNTPVTARVALLTNLGDTYVAPSATLDGVRAHRLGLSGAGWLTLTPKLSAFGEYAGSRLAHVALAAVHYVDAGVALTPVPSVQLDLRTGHGLNGIPHDFFVGAGVTRRW